MYRFDPKNSEKLFVRRITTISSPENFSEKFTFADKCYINQMKPLLVAMKYTGLLPLTVSKSGIPTFRVLSPLMVYSVWLYIWLLVLAYFNAGNILLRLFENKDDFLTYTFNALMLDAVILSCCLPVILWLDCAKYVQYFNKWAELQVLFLPVTGSHLALSLRRAGVRQFTYSLLFASVTLGLNIYEPYWPAWRMPSFYVVLLQLNVCSTFRAMTFSALQIASATLVRRFKRYMDVGPSAQRIGDYRILWLRLSHVVLKTGETMGKVWVAISLAFIFTQNMTLYGFLSNLISKKGDTLRATCLGIGAGFGLMNVYKWCCDAQDVEECARSAIQETLHLFRPHLHSHEVQVEVNTFLQTISMNAPVISLLGFADVNKQLFRGFVAALVTYLIVLLQFDIGQRASVCDLNVTRSV